MRMSDIIEDFIKDLFEEDENNFIEIQRNELAQHFNCVPSQINYVISTRFKPSQGYYVESKRGGGGNIRIKKINNTKTSFSNDKIWFFDSVSSLFIFAVFCSIISFFVALIISRLLYRKKQKKHRFAKRKR